MVSQIIPFRRVSPQRDWTNDELAELYRVEHSLLQARIALETDRGVSDEGDPWFVFCRPEGDVLVHVTRFDGLYRLYSPALAGPLTGTSLSSLATSFAAAIPVPAPMQQGKDARVVLHPAAMLSILIVTIFFSADIVTGNSAHAAETQALPGDPSDQVDGVSLDGYGAEASKSLLKEAFSKAVSSLVEARAEQASAQNSAYFVLVASVIAFAATAQDGAWAATSQFQVGELEGPTKAATGSHHESRDVDLAFVQHSAAAKHYLGEIAAAGSIGANAELQPSSSHAASGEQPADHAGKAIRVPSQIDIAPDLADVPPFTAETSVPEHGEPFAFADPGLDAVLASAAPVYQAAQGSAGVSQQSQAGEAEPSPRKVSQVEPAQVHAPAGGSAVQEEIKTAPVDVSGIAAAILPPLDGVVEAPIRPESSPPEAPPAKDAPPAKESAPPKKATPAAEEAHPPADAAPVPEEEVLPPQDAAPLPTAEAPPVMEELPSPEDIAAEIDNLVLAVKANVAKGAIDIVDLLNFEASHEAGDLAPVTRLSYHERGAVRQILDSGREEYGIEAKLQISAFLKAVPNTEILVMNGNIVIVDEGHIRAPDLDVRTWSLDDGGTISIIGHLNQIESFV